MSLNYSDELQLCIFPQTLKTHTKFVQDVRYAPSGNVFASVGSDSKILLYDGKTGDVLHEVTDSPHKGSIVCRNPLLEGSNSFEPEDGMHMEY